MALAVILALQESTVQDLIQRLGDKDIQVRDEAAQELVRRGPAVLPDLAKALEKEEDKEVRARLAAVRKSIERAERMKGVPEFSDGFRRTYPDLAEALLDPTPEVARQAFEKALGTMFVRVGQEWQAVPTRRLGEGVTDSDFRAIVKLVLRGMAASNSPAEWRTIREALKRSQAQNYSLIWEFEDALPFVDDPDEKFREILLPALGSSKDPRHLPALIKLLGHADRKIAGAAAGSLASLDPGEHAAELVRRLETHPPYEPSLLRSLANTGDRKFGDLVFKRLRLAEPSTEDGLLLSLVRLDPERASDYALERLRSGEVAILSGAMKAVGCRRTPEILKEIRRIALEGPADLRDSALYELGELQADDLAETYVKALNQRSAAVRSRAAYYAAYVRDDRLKAAVVEALDDPDVQVRTNAATTLGAWREKGHEAKIRAMLDNPDASEACVLLALARLGDEDAKSRLLDRVRGGNVCTLHIDAAAAYGGPEMLKVLRPFLDRKSPKADDDDGCLAAARALTYAGESGTRDVLVRALEGMHWQDALEPLTFLASQEVHDALKNMRLPPPDDRVMTVGRKLEMVKAALREKSIVLDDSAVPKNMRAWGCPWHWPHDDFATTFRRRIWAATEHWWGWFVDGKTVILMDQDQVRKRWSEWAKKK